MPNNYLEQVMQKLDEIQYGWFDIYHQKHINTIENIQELYRLASIEEILENKIGICFDQVELERYFFQNIYKTESYAIVTHLMVHAFLVLEKNNKFIYFEHSSYKNKGIYYFDNLDELLEYVISNFMNNHHIKTRNKIKLIRYEPILPGTTFKEIKNILLNDEYIKKM